MRGFILLLIFILFSFFQSTSVSAAPQSETSLSNRQITPDETTIFQIQVQWPKSEGKYSFAFPNLTLSNLEIVKQGESQENFVNQDQEWIRKTFLITLQPKGAGQATIGAFVLPYIHTATQETGNFQIPEQILTVKNSSGPWGMGLIAAGFVILMIAGVLIFIRLQKKQTSVEQVTPEDPLLARLQSLLSERGNRPLNISVQDLNFILRQFLETRYQIQALKQTESEVIRALKEKGVGKQDLEDIQSLFVRIEDVRFAGHSMTESDFLRFHDQVSSLIRKNQIIGKPE